MFPSRWLLLAAKKRRAGWYSHHLSWTKGGKERDIPIRTEAQRELLQDAKMLAGAGSLIPAEMSYKDPLNRFKAQTARAGIDRVHGLRHQLV